MLSGRLSSPLSARSHPVPGGPPHGTTVTKTIRAGESLYLPARHVHAVTNRASLPATSVHVYSPPLRSMGFYRADDEGQLVLERVEEAST